MDAPKDPVVDEAHLLSTEQGDILREVIAQTVKDYDLHVYIWTSDVATEEEAVHEATRKVHHWAPSGYVIIAHFSSVPGVKPVITYSQDIMVKLSDEQKAAILADMIQYWSAGTEPSEKVLMAARHLIRNEALWEPWYKAKEATNSDVVRSVSFRSSDITEKDGQTTIKDVRRGAPIGGNADKVQQQQRPAFFDWQKQVMAANAFLVVLIIGGALFAFFSQRRASLYREEQMRRGAEILTPLEPNRRRPPVK